MFRFDYLKETKFFQNKNLLRNKIFYLIKYYVKSNKELITLYLQTKNLEKM